MISLIDVPIGGIFAQDVNLSEQRKEKQWVLKVPGKILDRNINAVNPTPVNIIQNDTGYLDVSKGFLLKTDKNNLARIEKEMSDCGLKLSSKGVTLEIINNAKISHTQGVMDIPGAYNLNIGPQKIKIYSNDNDGIFYALQTLRQLKEFNDKLPLLEINDYPNLKYRGLVEGFYGNPWSHETRLSLIDFLGRNKMNTYIYGPKDDPYHSSPNWRLPYPPKEAAQLVELIERSDNNHVNFVWAIHPGQDIRWNEEDYQNLLAKLNGMYDLGVKSFAIFFDDIEGIGADSYKQTELLNRLTEEFVKQKGDVANLMICPTDYTELWANPNPETGQLAIYGNTLNPDVEVFWTGEFVCSDLTPETLEFVNSRIKRPALYWWNFPVTDYVRNFILQGPSYGLNSNLTQDEVAGIVSNPMEHGEASKIALYGVADYTWNSKAYNPIDNWERSIVEIVPEAPDAYRTFAIHNADTETGYRRDESWETETFSFNNYSPQQFENLKHEFQKIVEVPSQLQIIENKGLLKELEPWLIEFGKLGQRGLKTLEIIKLYESGDKESFLKAYIENIMSPQEKDDYNAHKVGTFKLQPFYEDVMSEIIEDFYSKNPDYLSEPLNHVNPFIGTTNRGCTNPGAVTPNGMMSVTPFNVMGSASNEYDKDKGWWSAPYDFNNKFFTGFAHVALSGVGCPDLSSILSMATTGDLYPDYHDYGSYYSDEISMPGYYSNVLTKYNIKTEVTASPRGSVERFTFPSGKGNILINLGEGLTNESGAYVKKVNAREIEGTKLMGTFCYRPQAVFPIYFVARVNKKPSADGFWKKQPLKAGPESNWDPDDGKYKIYTEYSRDLSGDDIGFWWSFDNLKEGEQIELKIGVSFVSMENARENLNKETNGLNFDAVRTLAYKEWTEFLKKVEIKGGTPEQQEIFYTALYHSLLHPNILNDVNGEYPKMESGSNGKTASTRYTVFSLWDTYRNLHQLLTLLYPEIQTDMVRSVIGMANESGRLPRWELYGRESFTMEGDPAIPMIIDSYMKGITDIPIKSAYRVMKKSASISGKDNKIRPDIDVYIEKGYIPVGTYEDDMSGDNSVSHALEYYVADNALAWLADKNGDKEFADSLRNRANGWKKYYSKQSGTFRPIDKNGNFIKDFNPEKGKNFENTPGFHEGSAWNYTFYIPHDIKGLAQVMGGDSIFVEKLQYFFDNDLYDATNEPNIGYPFIFNQFEGEEWRTQKETNKILKSSYKNSPDGLPGNDDAGTMSAWAIFTMMGLYPEAPASEWYTLTSPVFEEIKLNLKNDVVINITTERENPDDLYIQEITWNGEPIRDYRISHSLLTQGGNLHYKLASNPKK